MQPTVKAADARQHTVPERVLIVAHTTTFLTELAPFGRVLRERACAETIFYLPFVHFTANRFAETCADEGVTCLLAPVRESLAKAGLRAASDGSAVHQGASVSWFASRVAARLASRLPGIGQSFVAERLAFATLALEINDLLAATGPRLLVLGGDMVGYDTSLYIKIAHERGIPVLIVPSTMSNGLEQAEVYYGDPNYHVTGRVRRLIAMLFPKWVITHKDVRLFRCPPGRVLAMEAAGLAPPQPWVFNSGSADAIAMESQAMIDYYAAAGMKHRRMVLTGSPSDDAMTERLASAGDLRRRLCGELNLDPARPLVVTALPPDFLYVTGGRPQCDFQKYDDLVAFWIGSFVRLKACNCVVALHPSVDPASMRHIESENVRIGLWKTAEMVPACDIYVASISSTIRWAIACGKPVVNYDVYRYRYTDFLRVPGVLATEEQAEFRSMLERLVEDAEHRDAVARSMAAQSMHWGMMDGGVGERMMALVERLSGIAARPESVRAAIAAAEPTAANT